MVIDIPVLEEIKEDKITTVVAEDLEIKGTIKFKSSVMLKGVFEGEIESEGLLVVGSTAKVTATISTETLVSHGLTSGNVEASKQIVLKGTSTHTGDLKVPFLTIESGAIFNGKSVMERTQDSGNVLPVVEETPTEQQPVPVTFSEQPVEESTASEAGQQAADDRKQDTYSSGSKKKGSKDKTMFSESSLNDESMETIENGDSQEKALF